MSTGDAIYATTLNPAYSGPPVSGGEYIEVGAHPSNGRASNPTHLPKALQIEIAHTNTAAQAAFTVTDPSPTSPDSITVSPSSLDGRVTKPPEDFKEIAEKKADDRHTGTQKKQRLWAIAKAVAAAALVALGLVSLAVVSVACPPVGAAVAAAGIGLIIAGASYKGMGAFTEAQQLSSDIKQTENAQKARDLFEQYPVNGNDGSSFQEFLTKKTERLSEIKDSNKQPISKEQIFKYITGKSFNKYVDLFKTERSIAELEEKIKGIPDESPSKREALSRLKALKTTMLEQEYALETAITKQIAKAEATNKEEDKAQIAKHENSIADQKAKADDEEAKAAAKKKEEALAAEKAAKLAAKKAKKLKPTAQETARTDNAAGSGDLQSGATPSPSIESEA